MTGISAVAAGDAAGHGETVCRVVDLVTTEVALLDAARLDEWLGLFAPECTYWVPIRADEPGDPRRQVSIIYDDRTRMRDRVWRLTSGQAHAQNPPSRTVRVLGTIRVSLPAADRAEAVANFILAEYRLDAQREYAGTYRYVVELDGDRALIASKRVDLISSEGPIGNLSFVI